MPRRGALAPACALLATAAVVAGCGSSGGSASGGSASPSSLQQRFFQARLDFARCLRSHGVDVPDPTPGGGPGGGGGGEFRRLRQDPSAQAALQACRPVLRRAFGTITPQERAQIQQQFVRFAQCLRSHGVNVPDPTPGNGPGGFGIRRAFGSVDRNSPQFQQAIAACRGLLPRFGGGGGPPPGGGG